MFREVGSEEDVRGSLQGMQRQVSGGIARRLWRYQRRAAAPALGRGLHDDVLLSLWDLQRARGEVGRTERAGAG
jgi:hypothetical protein